MILCFTCMSRENRTRILWHAYIFYQVSKSCILSQLPSNVSLQFKNLSWLSLHAFASPSCPSFLENYCGDRHGNFPSSPPKHYNTTQVVFMPDGSPLHNTTRVVSMPDGSHLHNTTRVVSMPDGSHLHAPKIYNINIRHILQQPHDDRDVETSPETGIDARAKICDDSRDDVGDGQAFAKGAPPQGNIRRSSRYVHSHVWVDPKISLVGLSRLWCTASSFAMSMSASFAMRMWIFMKTPSAI